ncbi:Protein kinase domain-containing protein [Caenorhabditis elegans]|uniref:EFF-1A n=1 Tax=Caenorhabditis elegans TaxID=6239 RepID=G5ECA1_CAEEL|nr:Protein kinase domain-containing protein [Caenorhabditis elegans]AAL84282.1 EFF-1A precursor [Caenorhabditis elegans]4CYL_A Chain A, Eff-1a [Caenorhabditis elegans]CAA91123.1 Protein kinase domain-containing protein [Caenorhabditis elegans]|eukprot:NP_001021987.1 Epithelial Fusion Failure [Caenorhabditis elegans]
MEPPFEWSPQFILLLLAVTTYGFPLEEKFDGLFRAEPPHCSKTPIVRAQTSQNAMSSIARGMQMQFSIGLHTAVCFRLYEDTQLASQEINDDENAGNQTSLLHTIRLEKLEHHHPITQRYTFGIPEVHASCICECDATSSTCTAESHQFTACPESDKSDETSSCYRTFFPNQTPIGCSEDDIPKLCCDVRFKPYKNMTFLAVKLEQPTTYATFVYAAYDFVNGYWVEKDKTKIRSQLDGGTQDRHLDQKRRISLAVTAGGRASHQLETGMYFSRTSNGGETEELRMQPLNEITDNNFDRLGWYRMDDSGHFHVNNGVVKMDDIHKAKVKNCKEQTYKSILSANHYMPGHFNLTRPLEVIKPWIQSARIFDSSLRQAVVTHAEGTNLQISIHLDDEVESQNLVFFHNASRIRDFSGSIIVDSKSNRLFNLTVYEASGKIDGSVKMSTGFGSDTIHTFTAYVSDLHASNRSMIIPLPAIVGQGARAICLRADSMADIDKICHVIEYFESPLEIDLVEGKWHEMIGTCPTCNQINFNGMMKFLNPAHWIKGISSIGDGVMIATDIVVYLGVLCILYLLITKIIVPLVRCWVCPMSIFCNGSSSSSKNKNDKRRKEREERRRKDKFVSESEDGARSSSEPHDTLARYHGNHSERHYSSSQYI